MDFETKRLHIRSVEEKDKEPYMSLRSNNSDFSAAYEILPGFFDYEWEGELNSKEDIYLSVFFKDNGIFVGSASIQSYKEDIAELGFDVCKEYWNQGIATEILNGLIGEAYRLYKFSKIVVRANKDNLASRRVAEKCGGAFEGYEDSPVNNALKRDWRKLKVRPKKTARTKWMKSSQWGSIPYAFTVLMTA